MKKLICLILICLLPISLTSCTSINRFKGDMSKLSYDDNDNLLYGENSYYRADDRFEVRTTSDDTVIDLGWYSQFPFFPDMHYYAFNENPLFIFCDNSESFVYNKGLYVKSNYDIYNKLFAIEDTNIEISLSSAMTISEVEVSSINHEASIYFQMYLKDDSRIQIHFSGPYEYNNNWYVIRSGEVWSLSNKFVEALKDNYIIVE